MRSRLPLGIAAVLLTIMAVGTQVATALEPGRLTALAARQELRDEICVAMSDGQIGPLERSIILSDAKRILKPEEFEGFKQALNRASPPKPSSVKSPAQMARKGTKVAQKGGKGAQKSTKVAQKKGTSPAKQGPVAQADSSPGLTIPADVMRPDHVALTSVAW
jgi:hypothetical protein